MSEEIITNLKWHKDSLRKSGSIRGIIQEGDRLGDGHGKHEDHLMVFSRNIDSPLLSKPLSIEELKESYDKAEEELGFAMTSILNEYNPDMDDYLKWEPKMRKLAELGYVMTPEEFLDGYENVTVTEEQSLQEWNLSFMEWYPSIIAEMMVRHIEGGAEFEEGEEIPLMVGQFGKVNNGTHNYSNFF